MADDRVNTFRVFQSFLTAFDAVEGCSVVTSENLHFERIYSNFQEFMDTSGMLRQFAFLTIANSNFQKFLESSQIVTIFLLSCRPKRSDV